MANNRLFTGEPSYLDKDGYKYIKFNPEHHDPYKVMFTRGYAPEHRIAMAMHLKEVLKSDQHVNHKDRNRINNEIDNLILISAADHLREHREQGHFKLFSSEYQPHRNKKKSLKTALKKQAFDKSKAVVSLSGALAGGAFPFLLNYLKKKENREGFKDTLKKSFMGSAIGGTAANVGYAAYRGIKNPEQSLTNARDLMNSPESNKYKMLISTLPTLPGLYKEITAKTDEEKEKAHKWLKRGALLSALGFTNQIARKI